MIRNWCTACTTISTEYILCLCIFVSEYILGLYQYNTDHISFSILSIILISCDLFYSDILAPVSVSFIV